MVLEDMFEIKAGGLFGVDICSSGTEMSHLGETVNTNKDRVKSSRQG
jgi:hypothetical protein